MSKNIFGCIIFIILYLSASAAFADCKKDGVAYPVGTEIGGFVCTKDGKWEKK